jgi:hypothetical protein
MKQIKTIVVRDNKTGEFDKQVNAALQEGWELKKREVLPGIKGIETEWHRAYYAELEREELSPDVKKIFDYIEEAISRPHGDSFWIDEKGHRETADASEAIGWWCTLMKPELLRVMPEIIARGEPET